MGGPWRVPKALAPGGADQATAGGQTSRQSADRQLQMDMSSAGFLLAVGPGESRLHSLGCPAPGLPHRWGGS